MAGGTVVVTPAPSADAAATGTLVEVDVDVGLTAGGAVVLAGVVPGGQGRSRKELERRSSSSSGPQRASLTPRKTGSTTVRFSAMRAPIDHRPAHGMLHSTV